VREKERKRDIEERDIPVLRQPFSDIGESLL
jgi:hypothetical protein